MTQVTAAVCAFAAERGEAVGEGELLQVVGVDYTQEGKYVPFAQLQRQHCQECSELGLCRTYLRQSPVRVPIRLLEFSDKGRN